MPRALDLLSDDRRDELKALAHEAMLEGGHLEVHRVLTAEFFGDDWAEELALLDGMERWDAVSRDFYGRLVSSRLFTLQEKERFVDRHPLTEALILGLEIVMRGERETLRRAIGELIADVDRDTVQTLTGSTS